jgi:hypothetical protein
MLAGKLADSLAISLGVRQNNRQPHSIVYTLLEKFTRQPTTKIEEFPRQITLGENDALRANKSANRVSDVTERSDKDARIGSDKDPAFFVHSRFIYESNTISPNNSGR